MKTLLSISFLISVIFALSSCSTTKKITDSGSIVIPFSDTVILRDGSIVYGLPRTVFSVYVKMERTVEKPGPYARYASDLLGLDDVIQNDREYWSIKEITVKAHDELDPSEFFVIKCKSVFQSNVLTLKKEGLILDLNPASVNSGENEILKPENRTAQFHTFDLGSDEYFQSQKDTAYKRVTVDSSFIRVPYVIEKKKKIPVDQLAEKAAKRLMDMREGKHMILTGEATVFPQNDAAINEINRIEKEYTELFTGKVWKETKTYTFQIIPEKELAGKQITLVQFSDKTGPISDLKKGGIPLTVELIPERKTKDLTIINKNQAETGTPVFDKLFYRVPDVVNLKINLGPETLFSSRKLIYQFGEVIQLPGNYIIGR
jgi:hypothetical protein